jgi:hypothetical protein
MEDNKWLFIATILIKHSPKKMLHPSGRTKLRLSWYHCTVPEDCFDTSINHYHGRSYNPIIMDNFSNIMSMSYGFDNVPVERGYRTDQGLAYTSAIRKRLAHRRSTSALPSESIPILTTQSTCLVDSISHPNARVALSITVPSPNPHSFPRPEQPSVPNKRDIKATHPGLDCAGKKKNKPTRPPARNIYDREDIPLNIQSPKDTSSFRRHSQRHHNVRAWS